MHIMFVHPNDPAHCQILNVGDGCMVELRQTYRAGVLTDQELRINGRDFVRGVLTPFYFNGEIRPWWWREPPEYPDYIHCLTAQNWNSDLSMDCYFQLARLMPEVALPAA